jgi:hypothetical protein
LPDETSNLGTDCTFQTVYPSKKKLKTTGTDCRAANYCHSISCM